MLCSHQQIIFDRAFGQMLTRHFYLIHHEFPSSDRFEGWIYTYNRRRYKVIISYDFSCSCQRFQQNNVCKHLLFVLKRIFNANLYSFDLRLSIMRYHQFTTLDLEHIFQGQIRRLCPIVSPVLRKERLLIADKTLVTCFYSCGKSMHENCMNEWKRVNKKSTNCPLCQAHWIKLSAAQKAVLDHYAHRYWPMDKREKYILCCLYTPPDRF
jgi:hypothetical protein